jgi:hypothetical protein
MVLARGSGSNLYEEVVTELVIILFDNIEEEVKVVEFASYVKRFGK